MDSFEIEKYGPRSELAFKRAKEQNLRVILPESNELLIDFDNSVDYDYFETNKYILESLIGVKSISVTPSLSSKPGHLHARVVLKRDVSPIERVALQAALGSDRKRELLAVVMIFNKDATPTLFLEKP